MNPRPAMTPRQRLLTTLSGGIPDCVPVAPDVSNMVPCRLTGRPFWDLYLYRIVPPWEAYIACAKHFGFDAVMDGYFPLSFPEERRDEGWQRVIVERTSERIVTRSTRVDLGRREWAPTCEVYPVADSPTHGVPPEKIHLPLVPPSWEPLEGVREVDTGPEGLRRVKELMGDQGLVGAWLTSTVAIGSEEALGRWADDPDSFAEMAEARVAAVEARWARMRAMPVQPDFICVGGSGTLIWQSVKMFRQLALPAVKRAIELATAAGIPTHVHSCGPESALVKIMAEETSLSVIDPLEIAPMGNCNLAELKAKHGGKLTLKGNLHTTEVMLRGSVADVVRASRQAIDDAGRGGRFILSTGDQCGRDTPDANLRAMIDTARTYGRYRGDGTVAGLAA